jgi:hypothetical protein
MFEKCQNCGLRLLINAKRDENGAFCSAVCQQYFRYPGFCKSCAAATTEESAGSTFTMNGVGTELYGSKDPCQHCGSIIRTKFIVFVFIPLIPLGKYRFKWATPHRYVSRKLKPA